MITKRIMRWGIVLFLLAALPVMTAVMAQAQEPVALEAPATWNVYESEPNNSLATADLIHINDVVGADHDGYDEEMYCISDDYFRFNMPQDGAVTFLTEGWFSVDAYSWIEVLDATGNHVFGFDPG